MSAPDAMRPLMLGDFVRLRTEDGCMVVKGIHGGLAYCVPVDPGALWPTGTFMLDELQRVEPSAPGEAQLHDI